MAELITVSPAACRPRNAFSNHATKSLVHTPRAAAGNLREREGRTLDEKTRGHVALTTFAETFARMMMPDDDAG
jgi:hypothetical protein